MKLSPHHVRLCTLEASVWPQLCVTAVGDTLRLLRCLSVHKAAYRFSLCQVQEWSAVEVCTFLCSAVVPTSMAQYANFFEAEAIDGESLCQCHEWIYSDFEGTLATYNTWVSECMKT